MKTYLKNIDATKVEARYADGKYTKWHGDGKSQSGTKKTYQLGSMLTTSDKVYVTVAAEKGQFKDAAYVTYTASTWVKDDADIKALIQAMIDAL